jgi:hypothetical protein
MPTLGDMLSAAKHSATDFQQWMEVADPGFAAEARAAAERSRTSLAGFARIAVADFSRYADEEAWVQLTGILRNSEDPGFACLAAMVRWRLAQGCSSHSL